MLTTSYSTGITKALKNIGLRFRPQLYFFF